MAVTERIWSPSTISGCGSKTKVHAANSAVIAIRAVETPLEDRLEALDDEALPEAAERLS